MARAGGDNHYYGDTAEALLDPIRVELQLQDNCRTKATRRLHVCASAVRPSSTRQLESHHSALHRVGSPCKSMDSTHTNDASAARPHKLSP